MFQAERTNRTLSTLQLPSGTLQTPYQQKKITAQWRAVPQGYAPAPSGYVMWRSCLERCEGLVPSVPVGISWYKASVQDWESSQDTNLATRMVTRLATRLVTTWYQVGTSSVLVSGVPGTPYRGVRDPGKSEKRGTQRLGTPCRDRGLGRGVGDPAAETY